MDSKTRQWHEERRKGIGGSDAAAVVGLSPWKTALQVYAEKVGEVEPDAETQDMRRGTLLEPAIRQMYADDTGRQVVSGLPAVVHPELPFVRANLDGIASAERVLECKTARNRAGWGEPGSADIPVVYLCQVQHNMAAARLSVCDVAVLFGDFEFVVYTVDADQEFQSLLLEQEAAFWECVQRQIPPEPVSAEDLILRWPRSVVEAVTATRYDLEVARVLAAVKGRIKRLEQIADEAETELKRAIKDAEGLRVGEDLLCTWKSAKVSPRFDAKRFRDDNPDLYEKYLIEPAPTRRFLLKGNCPCLSTMHLPTADNLCLPAKPAALLPNPENEG